MEKTEWTDESREAYERFCAWDWARLGASVLCAAALCFLWPGRWLPGAGMAAMLLCALFVGVRGRGARELDGLNRRLIAACALLALTYAIFVNPYLRLLNLPVIAALLPLTLFSVNGRLSRAANEAESLGEAARLLPRACFSRMDAPFYAISHAKRARGVLAGALLAIPLFAVALLLLGEADDVFAGVWRAFGDKWAIWSPGAWIARGALAAVLALILFSFLFTLSRGLKGGRVRAIKPPRPQAVFALPMIALNALYALFIVIQFVYLFGGAETAAMKGGYAQYARKGFFELSAVCLMNLLFSWLAFTKCGYTRLLRALSGVMYAFTFVMLFSAAWRMALYISVYGLSFLRALTIWGIFAMGALAVASLVKALSPGVRAYPRAFAIVLASWLLLNYINVDACVALYNVSAYKAGRAETLDGEYLRALSADALPALAFYADECEEARAAREHISREYNSSVSAFEWGATCLFARGAADMEPASPR